MWFLHHNVWQFLSCVAAGNAKEGESRALTRQGRKEGEGATFSLRLLHPW